MGRSSHAQCFATLALLSYTCSPDAVSPSECASTLDCCIRDVEVAQAIGLLWIASASSGCAVPARPGRDEGRSAMVLYIVVLPCTLVMRCLAWALFIDGSKGINTHTLPVFDIFPHFNFNYLFSCLPTPYARSHHSNSYVASSSLCRARQNDACKLNEHRRLASDHRSHTPRM